MKVGFESNQNVKSLIANSKFFHQLEEYLSEERIRYVSLDIFDTFFRRKCSEPSWVFEETAQRVISSGVPLPMEKSDYRQCRIQAEFQARKSIALDDLMFSDIFYFIPVCDEIKNKLMEMEIEVESEVLYVDPFIELVIQQVIFHKKELIFVSDMYHRKDTLRRFITNKFPGLKFKEIFVSSEYGKTKHTGRLFTHVISELNLGSENLLHIGDNLTADVNSAQQLGITAVHFDVPSYIAAALEKEQRYLVDLPSEINHARKLAVVSAPDDLDAESGFFYNYGAFFIGPVLIAFSKWIISRCKILGVKNVLALMREGHIFSECVNRELQWDNDFSLQCIPCFASRKSTFLPSVEAGEIQSSIAQTIARKNYTVKDLCAEFELIDDRLLPFQDTPVTLLDKVSIDGQSGFDIVWQVVGESEFKILKTIENRKKALLDYFSSLPCSNESSFALVDFGAGGTIQYHLSKVLESKPITNYLLYVNSRGYSRSTFTPINSFIPFNEKTMNGVKKMSRSPEILEIVLVGVEQTTLAYSYDKDGNPAVIRSNIKYSSRHKKNVAAFEQGVAAFQSWSNYFKIATPTENERVSYLKLLERLIDCPEPEEVEFLGKLVHEDNFGSDKSYKVINSSGMQKLREHSLEMVYRNYTKNTNYASSWLAWPQGAISKVDPQFMKDHLFLRGGKDKNNDDANMLMQLVAASGSSEVIVYGAGEFFECIHDHLKRENIKIKCVIDKKANFGRYTVLGYDVISLSEANFENNDVVIIASAAFVDEIRNDIFSLVDGDSIRVISI